MEATPREELKALLEQALALPPDERPAFLNQACADDAALRDELDSLLAHADPAQAFFDSFAGAVLPQIPAPESSGNDPHGLVGQPVSHYQIVEKLGSGGMGVVYKADDLKLKRTVALKFLPPELTRDDQAKQRFIYEAQAASALDHVNVGYIHEIDETEDGRLFIAMAYYAGETLKAKIGRGALPVAEALDYAVQIAAGLSKAHERGIVHRDIKPANVMVTEDGVVKIVDFGLAKVLHQTQLTKTGTTLGTVSYMSPEQTRGEAVDARTDVWSLGVVLYEMLTGERPFKGDHSQAVIYSVLHEAPAPLGALRPEVPDALAGVVERLLEKDPVMRYQEASELVADLDAVQKGASPASFAGPLRRKDPRKSILAVAAVALLVVIAGLYVVTQNRGEDSRPESAPEAAPGIAVFPFSVHGQDLDENMREGMMSLLSTGLDGAAGLRTISPGTVFARWRDNLPIDETPDLTTQLKIARETEARYALVGSAVGIGSLTRLVADVYDVVTGNRLGQARSEGSSDDIFSLVDRLGVEVLSAILQKGEEELPDLDLASLTTDSPEALMAYLEGEVHHRHFDILAAQEAYTRAVEADSTFALAHSRLSQVYGYDIYSNLALSDLHLDRAAQLSDRLPVREALLVRAWPAQTSAIVMVDVLDALRQAVRTYPDDAEIWYALGENLYHMPGALAPAEDVEEAFERAVHLDPGNAKYLLHYMRFPWTIYADRQEAARRLDMYERASSSQNTGTRAGRIALDLAFGDSTAQAEAMARLETEDYDVAAWTRIYLNHPRYRQRLAVERMRLRRADDDHVGGAWWGLAINLTHYGRFHELLDLMEDPRIESGRRARMLYWLREMGFPVPVESLEEAMESMVVDSTARRRWIQIAGMYAADEARWLDHERAIGEMERRVERALANADLVDALRWTRDAQSLRGYGLWRRSGPEAALPFLGPDQLGNDSDWIDWWLLGQLYQELGRFRDAERVYKTYMPNDQLFSDNPLVQRELGGVYEALEEYDKAREAYEYFVAYWNDADDELQPMVEEARKAIIRLQQM